MLACVTPAGCKCSKTGSLCGVPFPVGVLRPACAVEKSQEVGVKLVKQSRGGEGLKNSSKKRLAFEESKCNQP